MFPIFRSPLRAILLTALAVAFTTGGCTRRNGGPGAGPQSWILVPEETHYGATYAEWGARWWQWAMELPRTNHPLYDEVGADAWRAQVDPVWFIGGIMADRAVGRVGSAERTVTIPSGKALFFPIINASADNTVCGGPDTTLSFTELRESCFFSVEHVQDVYFELDGVRVLDSPDLAGAFRYRAVSPEFAYALPADSVYNASFCAPEAQMPARLVDPMAADGIWMMIGPMPPGGHTLRFGGTFPVPNLFHLDIVYHIEVLP